MGILYKRFRDVELRDALIQSSIVAGGSVVWASRGKNYKRGTNEALSRLFISQQQKRVGSNNQVNSVCRVFWSVIKMVDLLFVTIQSVRVENQDLLFECVCSIISYAFWYDNVNYARYLSSKLEEKLNLEAKFPGILEEFESEHFAV